MFKIFDYNSKAFTLLAIIFICVLIYLNKDDSKYKTISANGAKYNIEIDPNSKHQTFKDKLILMLFKDRIDQGIENQSTKK